MKQPRGNNHKLGPDVRVGFVQFSLGCLMKRPALKLPPLVHFLGTPISVIIIFLISSLRKAGERKDSPSYGWFCFLSIGGKSPVGWRTRHLERCVEDQGCSSTLPSPEAQWWLSPFFVPHNTTNISGLLPICSVCYKIISCRDTICCH